MTSSKRKWQLAFPHLEHPTRPAERTSQTNSRRATDISARVCYGMICDVKAEFLENFAPADASLKTIHRSKETLYCLDVLFKRNYLLQSVNGIQIAVINTKTSNALRLLDQENLLQCEAFATLGEWSEKLHHFKNTGTGYIRIDLYFFGTGSCGKKVGKILSKCGLFLQHPVFLERDTIYKNPHYIEVTIAGQDEQIFEIAAESDSIAEIRIEDVIDSVLDGLDQRKHLNRAEVDRRSIKTILKDHQQEGMDFIAQREAEWTVPSFSLWKPQTDKAQKRYYQHLILGSRKSQLTSENFGGIIADEMGLGKTLTMLAAIFMSKGRAENFDYKGTHVRCPEDQGRVTRATLIVVPSAHLLENWTEEISRHFVSGSLKFSKYHGQNRRKNMDDTLNSDVVFTTYATVASDHSRGDRTMSNVHWFRVVLDEAHSICNQQTKHFQAVYSIQAEHRWCITATPIQNRLSDLGSLVRFLRVPLLEEPSKFCSSVSRLVEQKSPVGTQRLRTLLGAICIRRTNQRLEMPVPKEQTEYVELESDEKTEYAAIGDSFRQIIDDSVSSNTQTKHNGVLFQAILRLRILCNHGTFVSSTLAESDTSPPSPEEVLALLQQNDEATCIKCATEITSVFANGPSQSGVLTSCSHLICAGCVEQIQDEKGTDGTIFCPVCGVQSKIRSAELDNVQQEYSPRPEAGRSSKLESLTRNILAHPMEKSIVFSSWRKSIMLVAKFLGAKGVPACVVDGSMAVPEREKTLERFRSDPNVRALLMTLGTGAVGLNLTVASRIHILEPQWNPNLEVQAIGRAVRMGQEKQVTVIRYVARNTVEQHIQTRQSKKSYIARLGWAADMDQSRCTNIQEVKDLSTLLNFKAGQ